MEVHGRPSAAIPDLRSPFDPSLETYQREREWLDREVAAAATFTDADRIRILEDLLRTGEAIQRTKTPEQIEREDAVRRAIDGEGLARYRELAERFEGR
ncbi:MAG: hypothetical protein HYR85_23040 [Planctomycetes bacterium]|nr:hypothetical protein [Planctomycetota bacterium]MBI3843363.1 hypothetical protein [Planctomycetota bacterium]